MCEIFPEVQSCCGFCSLRVGMLFIAILSVFTGSMFLSVTLKSSNITLVHSIETVMMTKNIAIANATKEKLLEFGFKNSMRLAWLVAMAMGTVFVLSGFILLFGNITADEGIVQVFVWVTFLNVFVGLSVIAFMGGSCVVGPCALSDFDWLTAASVLLFFTVYLFFWVYFISVANSYVMRS